MPVKVFTGYEHEEIRSIDSRINAWFVGLPPGSVIRQIACSMCAFHRSDTDEDLPYIVVTLLYDEPDSV